MSLNNASTYLLAGIILATLIAGASLFLSIQSENILAQTTSGVNNSDQIKKGVVALSRNTKKTRVKFGKIRQAFKQGLLSGCKSEPSSQNHCYWGVATSFNDSGICSLISTDNLRDSCLSSIAMETESESLCERVQQKQSVVTCRAAITGSVSKCNEIEDKYEQTQCVNEVAKTQKDAEACSQAAYDNDYNRRNCLTRVAVENKDASFCEQICDDPAPNNPEANRATCKTAENDWKDSCFMKVGIVSRSESVCREVYGADKRNYCLGLVKEDQSYCNKITSNESYLYNCNAILKSDKTTDYESLFN